MRELEPESSSDFDSSKEMSEEPEEKTVGEMDEMSEGSGEEVYGEVDEKMSINKVSTELRRIFPSLPRFFFKIITVFPPVL